MIELKGLIFGSSQLNGRCWRKINRAVFKVKQDTFSILCFLIFLKIASSYIPSSLPVLDIIFVVWRSFGAYTTRELCHQHHTCCYSRSSFGIRPTEVKFVEIFYILHCQYIIKPITLSFPFSNSSNCRCVLLSLIVGVIAVIVAVQIEFINVFTLTIICLPTEMGRPFVGIAAIKDECHHPPPTNIPNTAIMVVDDPFLGSDYDLQQG